MYHNVHGSRRPMRRRWTVGSLWFSLDTRLRKDSRRIWKEWGIHITQATGVATLILVDWPTISSDLLIVTNRVQCFQQPRTLTMLSDALATMPQMHLRQMDTPLERYWWQQGQAAGKRAVSRISPRPARDRRRSELGQTAPAVASPDCRRCHFDSMNVSGASLGRPQNTQ